MANKLIAAANRHTTMCFNLRLFRWHTTSSVGRGWRVAWPGSAQRWHRAYRATPLGNIAHRLSRLKNVIPTNAYPCKHSRSHTCVDSTTGIERGQADQEHLDVFFGDQDKMFGPVYLPHYIMMVSWRLEACHQYSDDRLFWVKTSSGHSVLFLHVATGPDNYSLSCWLGIKSLNFPCSLALTFVFESQTQAIILKRLLISTEDFFPYCESGGGAI